MCGIAGFASTGPLNGRDHGVEAMTADLHRRGPDGTGFSNWPAAVLGHRRLAIIDLSERGRQPMVSEDGAIGLVFNGAIYNFVELRNELEAAGCRFQSDTDTEVLLHGYRVWGIRELTRRCSGMFAYAIWDERSGELFLVRDRLGVKPLLYAVRQDGLAFASTARALRAAGLAGAINDQAVIDFLEWGVVPEQQSIYAGIEKLPPATIARWHEGRLDLHRYWHPPTADRREVLTFQDAVDRTEELLLASARRRTRADVPIGALLSGGIDSALVCWALREAGSSVQAYTFAAPGEPEDETADARRCADELGIPLVVLKTDAAETDWDDLSTAYAEPFACASALGMLRLSKAAREAVTVLITGDGGDDVFLGYPHHRFLHSAQRIARGTPEAVARMAQGSGLTSSGPGRRMRNFASYLTGGLGAFLQVRNSARYFETEGLLGARLRGSIPASRTVAPVPGSGRTVLDDYLEYAREHQFVAEYLAKVDGSTMHYALEARSPFLDHELWEFGASLPYSIRLRGGLQKAVLREIARRRISERVAAGRKRGFEVPIQSWMSGRWRQRIEELLQSPALTAGGWLDGEAILKRVRQGSMPGTQLWYAVVLESWLRREAAA